MNRPAPTSRRALRYASTCLATAMALATAGCQTPGMGPLNTASISAPPVPDDDGRLRAYAVDMAARYAAHPEDKAIAVNYATALRRLTQTAQAVAVLQQLAVRNPHDMTVLAAYGKALADAGRLQEAADVLEHAHTPDRPNWTVLAAQGSVADQMGNHSDAQNYYAAALKIMPDQPQVLSNLGLSYALERRIPQAEATLRQAVAQPGADMRVRQNLALVLSLEGKYADAEEISRRDLAPIDAAQNVESIKQTIARSDMWHPARTRRMAARSRDQDEAKTRTASMTEPQ